MGNHPSTATMSSKPPAVSDVSTMAALRSTQGVSAASLYYDASSNQNSYADMIKMMSNIDRKLDAIGSNVDIIMSTLIAKGVVPSAPPEYQIHRPSGYVPRGPMASALSSAKTRGNP